MNPRQLYRRLRRAVRAESIQEFLGLVSSVASRIDGEVRYGRDRDIEETLYGLSEGMFEMRGPHELSEAHARLCAEALSAVVHPRTLSWFRDWGPKLWERPRGDDKVVRALQASMILVAFKLFDQGQREAPAAVQEMTRGMRGDDEIANYTDDCIADAFEPGQRLAAFADEAQTIVDACGHARSRGVTDALPGDVLFRDLSLIWCQSFGHAALYLGPDPQKGDGQDLDDHLIVEMEPWIGGLINLPINCVKGTVGGFKAHGGFWGAYAADISPLDPLPLQTRKQLVQIALSYVGQCTYGVAFSAYKNPKGRSFRCDGLIEHCFESLQPMAPRLNHRGGLFEDDNFATLSPNSLRSCLFEKRVNF